MQHQCNLAAERGLECTCVNNDDFTVLSAGAADTVEWACVLCGHRIQNDWLSRTLNPHRILPEGWMFLRGNYLDDSEGCSYGWLVIGSFIMTTYSLMHHVLCRVFCETSNHPDDSAPLQPRFGTLWLLAFPKTKITFEREEISDHWWDSGKTTW